MPIKKYTPASDATAVRTPAYRQLGVYETDKPVAEIRAIPANQRPLSWQLGTAGENYERAHDTFRGLFDKTGLTEAADEARRYYDDELAYESPVAAAIGSTLAGEAFDFWRDAVTDPINVATAGTASAPKAGMSLGVIKKFPKKYSDLPAEALLVTPGDVQHLRAAFDGKKTVHLSPGPLPDIPAEPLGLSRFEKPGDLIPRYYPRITAKAADRAEIPGEWPLDYSPWSGSRSPGDVTELTSSPRYFDGALYKGSADPDFLPSPVAPGSFGSKSAGTVATSWYGPGVYASSDPGHAFQYAGDEGSLHALTRAYAPGPENILQTWRTFADIESPRMREKLIALFGDEIAKEGRYRRIHDYVQGANAADPVAFFDDLRGLGIDEIYHMDHDQLGAMTSAILGDFKSKKMKIDGDDIYEDNPDIFGP